MARALTTLVAALAFAGVQAHAAQITWTGAAGTGLWSSTGNWDLARLPVSGDDVVIPIGASASLTTSASIRSLAAPGTFILDGGSLSVSAASTVSGTLDVRAGSLAANGAAASVVASGAVLLGPASLSASNGGEIDLAAATGVLALPSGAGAVNWTATGAGSRLDLSGLTRIEGTGASTPTTILSITAQTGAAIDLSGLTEIELPALPGARWINVLARNAGSLVDLSSLMRLRDLDSANSSLRAEAGGAIVAPSLVEVIGTLLFRDASSSLATAQLTMYQVSSLSVSGAGLDLSGITSLATTTSINVSGGELRIPNVPALPAVTSITVGAGGLLDLAQITSLAAGVSLNLNGGGVLRIPNVASLADGSLTVAGASSAIELAPGLDITGTAFSVSQGGVLTLPAVGVLALPSGAGAVNWTATGAGSRLDLSGLTRIEGTGASTPTTILSITAQTGAAIDLSGLTEIELPALPGARWINVLARNAGSLVDLSSLVRLRDLDSANSSLRAEAGGAIVAPSLVEVIGTLLFRDASSSLATAQLTMYQVSSLSVSGAGLDLSGITSLATTTSINVSGGELRIPNVPALPAVTSITVGAGGLLDLAQITSLAAGVSLNLNGGGVLRIPNVASLADGSLTVAGASSAIELAPGLDITGTAFSVSQGGVLTLPAVGVLALPSGAGAVNWTATGAGSRLDLSGLTRIEGTGASTPTTILSITAQTGAAIDLSGLTEIELPALPGARWINVLARNAGSLVDLSSLVRLRDLDSANSSLRAEAGGAIVAPSLVEVIGTLLFRDASSSLATAQLTMYQVSSLSVSGAGLDLSGITSLATTTSINVSGGELRIPNVPALPAVTSITVGAGGLLDLAQITSLAAGVSLNLNGGGVLRIPNVASLADGSLTVAGASSAIELAPGLDITGTAFSVSQGGVLTLPAVGVLALPSGAGAVNWTATGAGSRLDLSGLTRIEGTGASTPTTILSITAQTGAAIDLSGLTEIELPALPGARWVNVLVRDAGSLADLARLGAFTDADSGNSSLTTTTNGSLRLGALAALAGVGTSGSGFIRVPRITNTFPVNASVLSTAPAALSVSYVVESLPLSAGSTVLSLTRQGAPVSGATAIGPSLIEFTPSAALTDGNYVFSATLVDSAGVASPLSRVSFSLVIGGGSQGPASVPLTVSGALDGTSAQLSWLLYDEAGQTPPVLDYTIYQAALPFTSTASAAAVVTLPAGTTSHVVAGLPRAGTAHFAVVARDVLGNALTAVSSVAVTLTDVQPPEPPTQLVVASGADFVQGSWTASLDSDGDLTGYKAYLDSTLVDGNLPPATLSYTFPGLAAASAHQIAITAFDADGNESAPLSGAAVTYLPNPSNVSVIPGSGRVTVTWTRETSPYVALYRIYVENAPFSSVTGLVKDRDLPHTSSTTTFSGLTNGVPVYIAVATVNTSGASDPAVSAVSATPVADATGPTLSAPLVNGATLISGVTISASGTVSVSASDPSSVGRVEFYLSNGATETLLGVDSSAAGGYTASFDLAGFPDGAYTLIIRAYDTFNNPTVASFSVTITQGPPAAPAITNPASGLRTNQASLSVTGSAEKGSTVRLYLAGAQVAGPFTVDPLGNWFGAVTLQPGANALQAAAFNRGGGSPLSTAVDVTLDTSIPDPPTGLTATAQPDGEVLLTWSAAAASSQAVKYDVYRATQSFSATAQATRVNPSRLTTARYTDLPPSDGRYFYRVVAVNDVGTASAPSGEAFADSDSLSPVATGIAYASDGPFHAPTNRFAPGTVTATVQVSEPLLTTPFLSVTPQAGLPISVSLQLQPGAPQTYQGTFAIQPTTPTGLAFAVFSARDRVGNRGTQVQSGQTIAVDTEGPHALAVAISPAAPVENDALNPVTLGVGLTLDEQPADGSPQLTFSLSGPGRTPQALANVVNPSGDGVTWQTTLALPPDAGLAAPENLSFALLTHDDLGNAGMRIDGVNSFQIYQGTLPPLGVPDGLVATAQPAGAIALAWNEVLGAAAYQLYRRGPNAPANDPFAPLGAPVAVASHLDATSADGLYEYTVASVRSAGASQSESAESAPAQATADSIAPSAALALALQLTPRGISASWSAPAGGTVAHGLLSYRLYRANLAQGVPLDPAGRTPVLANLALTQAVDPSPSPSDHAYAVTAVDSAGNESPASNTEYLNFQLLPISTLSVVQSGASAPVVSWTHPSASIDEYRVSIGDPAAPLLVLPQFAQRTYTDGGWNGGERRYNVAARDAGGAESLERSLVLPSVELSLAASARVDRGVFNNLDVQVANTGATSLSAARMEVVLGGATYTSAPFSLAAGASTMARVIVGGAPTLASPETVQLTLVHEPNAGESARVVRSASLAISDSALFLQLETRDLTRGALGQARLRLENTSGVTTDIVTAENSGSRPSNEVRVLLLDTDQNVISVAPLLEASGASVLRLSNGRTVARVAPGGVYLSAWIDVAVPSSAPDDVSVVLQIDEFHHQLGAPGASFIAGHGTNATATVVASPYVGVLASIAPAQAFAGTDIVISGSAQDRASGAPLPSAALQLVLRVGGFERKLDVYTDQNGDFIYTFTPEPGEAGAYTVSVIYPGSSERPEQGAFTIDSLSVSPARFDVRVPRSYQATLNVNVAAGPATAATNVRVAYDAQDQAFGQLTPGITVTEAGPIDIAAGGRAVLPVKISADNSAPASGLIRLRALSTQTGAAPLALITVSYAFSSAEPALASTPTLLETGVVWDDVMSESIALENRGLAPLQNVQVALVDSGGNPAPSWIYLTSPAQLGTLAVGQRATVELAASPTNVIPEAYYTFSLRVLSDNLPPRQVPIVVRVAQNGIGSLLVHAADIYTATLDGQGNLIQGLAGARLRLTPELPDGSIDLANAQNLTADALGEALFQNVPAGSYLLRASAPDHNDVNVRVRIVPGTTSAQEVFLVNTVVSIEWSVREIALEDRYEIVLSATFQTDVPIPVIVFEPLSTTLPSLRAGDVFYGELAVTNHGLIDADEVVVTLPQADGVARFEFLHDPPAVLRAKERLVLPYRVTALSDFDPALASAASGGGCQSFEWLVRLVSKAPCANGTIVTPTAGASWRFNAGAGNCGAPRPPTNPITVPVTAVGQGSQGNGTSQNWGSFTPAPRSEGAEIFCPPDGPCD